MKNLSLLFLLLSLAMVACKSDSQSDTSGSDSDGMIEDNSEIELKEEEKEELVKALVEEVEEEPVVEEVELTNLKDFDAEGAKQKAQEAKEARKEIVSEQIEKSVNKGKDCAQIAKEYEAVVNKFIETQDDSALDPLMEWANDPVFNACKKDAEFKKKIDALDAKMAEVDF